MIKVTPVTLRAPAAMADAHSLTFEQLAAVAARYSRSNEGIETLLGHVDLEDENAGVEGIFKFVDYGHASIGGLTGGIPMFMDGISLFLLYKLFEWSTYADGQESSTRYIPMKMDSVIDPDDAGIPHELQDNWKRLMKNAFEIYDLACAYLKRRIETAPCMANITDDMPESKKVRFKNNYVFDRARHFLPAALRTNGVLIMTGRAWCDVIAQCEAWPSPEAGQLAVQLRAHLSRALPHLVKHSRATKAHFTNTYDELHGVLHHVCAAGQLIAITPNKTPALLSLSNDADERRAAEFKAAAADKVSRYHPYGRQIRRVTAHFKLHNVAFAELRDLNRHRTGFRFSTLKPSGFFTVLQGTELSPAIAMLLVDYCTVMQGLAMHDLHFGPSASIYYAYLLGTQTDFEHTQQLDKLIYAIELRTTKEAHFQYAQHYRDIYDLLVERLPCLREIVTVGSIEQG